MDCRDIQHKVDQGKVRIKESLFRLYRIAFTPGTGPKRILGYMGILFISLFILFIWIGFLYLLILILEFIKGRKFLL